MSALIEHDFTGPHEVVRIHPERRASAMDRALDDLNAALVRHRRISAEAVAAIEAALFQPADDPSITRTGGPEAGRLTPGLPAAGANHG
jgi:hypothetical protein